MDIINPEGSVYELTTTNYNYYENKINNSNIGNDSVIIIVIVLILIICCGVFIGIGIYIFKLKQENKMKDEINGMNGELKDSTKQNIYSHSNQIGENINIINDDTV